MSPKKSSAKNTQTQTSRKSSGKQAKETVEVGGGVLDRTTFKTYDIKKGATILAAAAEVSHDVTKTVYQRYGSAPPSDDDEAADCWIFPTGVDYEMPLSALPPAQPDAPPLMVLVKLRTDAPMMNCVLDATKHNMDKENHAGTPGDLAVLLAEFKAMKKDMHDVKTSNHELMEQVRGLKASNGELTDEVRVLKASNKELKASNKKLTDEVRVLKASNSKLEAEVSGLKTSNDEQLRSLKASDNYHISRVSRLEDKITTLEAELLSRKLENDKIKSHAATAISELTRFINMITPLHPRILVDKARRKVLRKTAFRTWHQYYATFANQQLCQEDVESLTSLPADVAAFISSPTTKVRQDGNKAAHNAEKEDILDAVERTNTTRHLLERTFEYVFHSQDTEENEGEDKQDEDEYHQDDEAEEV